MLIIFTACTSNEDCKLSEEILGRWELISAEAINCDSPSDNFERIEVGADGCLRVDSERVICDVVVVFSSNGTAISSILQSNGDTEENMFTYIVNEMNNTASLCRVDNEDLCPTISLISCNEMTWFFVSDDNCNWTYDFIKI